MTPIEIVLSLAMIAVVGLMIWKQRQPAQTDGSSVELERENAKLHASLEQSQKEVGSVRSQLEAERAEKQEQQGKSKQLFAQYSKMEAQLEQATKERDELKKKESKHEADAERHQKDLAAQLSKLEAAKLSLDQERQRVIREDEEKLAVAEANRDRIWADHEKNVVATMQNLCKQPEYAFTCYSNTDLPDGFDGSLKPDVMIEFLDQYVIFDAKKSKSESLSTYIANTVKTTVTKVKKNPKIATMIFLVVPSEAVSELKTHHSVHDGYTFYIISPEALAPILASLKRITAYELAEQMDPQDRENIVQFMADFSYHINLQNAANLVLSQHGIETLDKVSRTDPEMAEEIARRNQPRNVKAAVSAMQLKKLVASTTAQKATIDEIAAPRALVDSALIEAVQMSISEKSA